ncbi:hypothetical protein DX908_06840 [Parvularcula marina]|uniref:Uncharacterized protein n=2 Tax=Parvularcula marina TaxID=2292771 RepID=A0A371RHW0_9PROT|nr:hypothetical protein DX908_06840 [Parvularcula marina]
MGWKNQIVGRVLDDEREILVSFNFTSSKELVHVGDFLSISFTMVSIVDPAALSEKKYKLFDLIVEKNL